MADLTKDLAQAKENLRPASSVGLVGSCKGAKAYELDDVHTAYDAMRSKALQRFSLPAQAGTQAYLDRNIPVFKSPPPDQELKHCFSRIVPVSEQAVGELWGYFEAALKHLSRKPLVVDIPVRSNPEQALASLSAAAGAHPLQQRQTNAQFQAVYRGIYRLSVSKDGLKPVDWEVDLVDAETPRIHCNLVKASAQEASTCFLE